MKNKSLLLLYFTCLLSITACRKAWLPNPKAANDRAIFDAVWDAVDQRYTYFDLKGIDWDSVYQVYVQRIPVDGNGDEKALFKVLSDMLYVLQDGHVNLESPFDISRNWSWYLDRPQNFNYEIIERNYLRDSFQITGPFINRTFGNAGYIYYGSFQQGFTEQELGYLIQAMETTKGLILDLRDNGGGSLERAQRLASCFTDTETPAIKWQYKGGPARHDFTTPVVESIKPKTGVRYTKPLILLINRSTYSAGSFMTAYLKAMPHVIIMGDTTGGGGGVPWMQELPNGWICRFSSTRCKTLAGEEIETGISPHVRIDQTPADILAGKDPILDAAIERIHAQ